MNKAPAEFGVDNEPWFAIRNDLFALRSVLRLWTASWFMGRSSRVERRLAVRQIGIVLRIRWVWVVCSRIGSELRV